MQNVCAFEWITDTCVSIKIIYDNFTTDENTVIEV
jgi:hypothetical protein